MKIRVSSQGNFVAEAQHLLHIYYRYYLIQLRAQLAYKYSLTITTLLDFLTPAFFIFLWAGVAGLSKSKQIGDYDQNAIIAYFLIGTVLQKFTSTYPAREIIRIVKNKSSSTASSYLLNGLNFAVCCIIQLLAKITIITILSIIVIAVVFIVSPGVFNTLSHDPIHIISFILFFVLGLICITTFQSCIGLLRFYTMSANSYRVMLFNIVDFLSGKFLPLAFLPTIFKNIASYLPFSFIYYFPLSVILGKKSYEEIALGFIVCIFWMVLLIFIANKMYKKGLKYFDNLD